MSQKVYLLGHNLTLNIIKCYNIKSTKYCKITIEFAKYRVFSLFVVINMSFQQSRIFETSVHTIIF